MLTVLRNAKLFAPEKLGLRDLLLVDRRVAAIAQPGELGALPDSVPHEVHDLEAAIVVPGLVDAHVHVIGGGGEGGYRSRVPPLSLTDLSAAGVTTVVGLLGTDGTTRTMRDLVARTLALREEGLGAWCWTGSYEVPVKTLTGSVRDDMVFVDPILGVGELAISDHRSSQPSFDEFLRIAADVHVGGMLSGKAGVLHLHLGDGSRGLELVRRALDETELPARVFHPTHLNRNRELFADAMELAGQRGTMAPTMDVTAFPADDVGDGLSAADAIAEWLAADRRADGLTCSSDGGGCMPHFDAHGELHHYGVGQSTTLLETLRELLRSGHALERVLPIFTANPARLLRLTGKGAVAVGCDADLVILDPLELGLRPRGVIAGGRWLIRDGEALVRGPFESGTNEP